MYRTPFIGSRNEQTLFYWTSGGFEQVVCGCFLGSVDEFEEKVANTHGNNEHAAAYGKQIAIMRMLKSQEV